MGGKVSYFLNITTPKTVLKRVSIEMRGGSFEHEIYLPLFDLNVTVTDGKLRSTTVNDGK
jgi:hypothetical protein